MIVLSTQPSNSAKTFSIIAAFLCFFGTDTLLYASSTIQFYKYVFLAFYVVFFFTMLIHLALTKRLKTNNSLIFISVISTIIFISSIYNQDKFSIWAVQVLFWFSAYLISLEVNFVYFKTYFVYIIAFVSLVTLLLYPLIYLVRGTELLTITNISGYKFIHFGITLFLNDPNGIVRVYGPFWEPGVFQGYLSIAALFLLFTKDIRRKRLLLFILALTILLTFSPAGLLNLLLISVIILIKHKCFFLNCVKKHFWIFWFVSLISLLIVFAFLLLNKGILMLLFSKFSQDSGSYISFYSRQISILSNIFISMNNPFFGIGFEELGRTFLDYNLLKFQHLKPSNTNTITSYFAAYGIIVGSIYTISIKRFSFIFAEQAKIAWLVFIIFILILFNEPLMYSYFFHILFFINADRPTKLNIVSQKSKK